MVAAYRLLKTGHKVTVLEAGETLGGLAAGFKIDGASLEMAYHHIFKTDKDIINLADELQIREKLVWNESSIGLYYNGKLYPFVTPMDLLRFKPLGTLDKLRLGMVGIYLQKDKDHEKYINVPACQWMEKMCGRKAYRIIWEPLLKGKFHDYYRQVSMAWLWARIHTRGNSKEKGDTKEYLGYFDGGFQVVIDKLAEQIKKMGGTIRLNTRVGSINNEDESVEVKTDKVIRFDKLICTVPSYVFAGMIDTSAGMNYLNKLNSIDYLGAVVSVFTSKQNLSEYYWHNINDPESPFLAFIQHTNLIGRKKYGGEEVYYMGTYVPNNHKYFEIDNKKIEQEFLGYLKRMFPKFDKNKITNQLVFKLKNAQHVVGCDYPKNIPSYRTPINNVFLSNFSQIFPEDRGINFAVREGNKIAKIVSDS